MSTADVLNVLWTPLRIGSVSVPSRVAFAAHTTGFRGEQYGAYLAARARGGAGLVITGASAVHPTAASDAIWNAYDPTSTREMRLVVDEVHAAGAPLFVQLGHGGVHGAGATAIESWGLVIAPSAVPSPAVGLAPKTMEQADIDEIIEGFCASAVNCRAAGADGVELHAAHGYLLSEFLSPVSNQREDGYGGSTENRARLVVEIGEAIRARCGSDFAVGVKLNVDEFIGDRGITPDEALRTLSVLHGHRLFDYFGLSAGNYESFHYLVAPETSDLAGHLAVHAGSAREAIASEVPVMVTGRIRSLGLAAEIVGSGQADLVGMIRAQIADPEIVRKARLGKDGEIRRCTGANQGCWRRVAGGDQLSCTVNPVTGREALWAPGVDAARRLRVLVVGGGPAGMKLAETAAARGHHVTIVERQQRLGGQLRYAAELPHRSSWGHVVEDLEGALGRLGVEIRLGTDASPGSVADFGAEVTCIATGAIWDMSGRSATRAGLGPDLAAPGCEIVDPVAAVAGTASLGNRVVIVDDNGDYLPLGLAEKLAATRRAVTIVTPHMAVGRRLGPDATVDFAWVYPRLMAAGVEVVTGVNLERIKDGRVELAGVWADTHTAIEADAVVLCMMRRSDDALYHELRAAGVTVRRLGDCVAAREADHAVFEGIREGMSL